MRFGSICSGIEAATMAWSHLGWNPVFYSEIDPFPRAVLKHRHPNVPLVGDFTKIQEEDYDGSIDLLCGGTPCQSFSVAGFRKGMDDERGNLTLEFVRLVDRCRPRWIVWENVPGVLSSDEGRDFGAFLGALVELGYGWAYRVLDAQYVRAYGYPGAVPQRRRRVVLVGYLGDWRPPAAVLFERESLFGHTPPRRKSGADVATSLTASAGSRGEGASGGADLVPDVGGTLNSASSKARPGDSLQDARSNLLIPEVSGTLSARDHKQPRSEGIPVGIVPVAFQENQRSEVREVEVPGALGAHHGAKQQTYLALSANDYGNGLAEDVSPTLRAMNGSKPNGGQNMAVATGMAVRRLTPVECERLQGFPDGYTQVPYRGRPADKCPDGPRYKALGNSWAVNVFRWVGERIQAVEEIIND